MKKKANTQATSPDPRRRQRQTLGLLGFLTVDFLVGAVYFLYGYVAYQSVGVAGMAQLLTDTGVYSISVDTSEFLWWSLPFLAAAAILGGWFIAAALRYRKMPAAPRTDTAPEYAPGFSPDTPDTATEYAAASSSDASATAPASARFGDAAAKMNGAHVVDAAQIRTSDLRDNPDWLTDPLTFVRTEDGIYGTPLVDLRTRTHPSENKRKKRRAREIPFGGSLERIDVPKDSE